MNAPAAPTNAVVTPGAIASIIRALEVLVGVAPNPQVEITSVGGFGEIRFLTNSSLEAIPGAFGATVVGSGGAQYLAVILAGPESTSQSDRAGIGLTSAQATPAGPALVQLFYNDTTGAQHLYATCGAAGFTIFAGSLVAVEPGTGTVATPAVAESWHSATLTNNWTGSGSGVNGLWYRLIGIGSAGMVEIIADIANAVSDANTVCFTLPAGYQPATAQNHPAAWNNPVANNSSSIPWVNINTSGAIQITGQEAVGKETFFHIFMPLESL